MIKLEEESDFNVRQAKPGLFSWICIVAAAYSFISGIGYWTEMVNKLSPAGMAMVDDVDSAPVRVMNLVNALSNFNEVGIVCFVVAFLATAFFLGRTHFLSTKYAHSKAFAIMSTVLAYLALLPLVMQVQDLTAGLVGHFSDNLKQLYYFAVSTSKLNVNAGNLIVNHGGLIACDVCLVLLIAFAIKWLLFSRPFVNRYAEGLVVGVNPWRVLWGAKLIHWSDIRKAAIRRSKKNKDVLVIQTKKFKYEFPWDIMEKAFDPTEFMNELRSKCPAEVLDDSLSLREELKHDASTYTELWLKYFSASSARVRSGQLSPGDKLHDSKYEIAGELGAGGQGTAYLASMADEQTGNVRTIVLKEYILPVHRGDSIFQQSMRKLQQEAEILEKIRHQNIVQLIDTFVEDHRGYLVMEYVEGRTLKQLVQDEGRQPESFVIDIALQICDILEHLHSMEPLIIHRDLTPDNLILQPDGRLKLVDFNVAHKLESAATATVVGKHAYLPPEQFRGKPTEQSDIYAFGGTLFFLLTGHDPPPLASSHPRKVVESVNEKLNDIVAKATALDLAKRSSSAKKMREELLKLDGARDVARRQNLDLAKDDPHKSNPSIVADYGFENLDKTNLQSNMNGESSSITESSDGTSDETGSEALTITPSPAEAVSIHLKEEEAIER
ncbi:MAG: serine/threonine protein kinase [Candidatus Obscuribacterales bacterium]|nr:serine/threonine protein kinase [Candidatus Obscuribacterales bacterium]